jgi:predicted XRE-type DNA-binding protein
VLDKGCNWRVIYRIESDAIVILDVFPKKSQGTPKTVIEQSKARLAQYLRVIEQEADMEMTKRVKLEAAGWAVSTPKEFLNLSEEDAAFLEVKVALAAALRGLRMERALSQVEAAQRLHSSQSRVAKMEAADRSVSVDLLLRSLLRLGGTRERMVAALTPVAFPVE